MKLRDERIEIFENTVWIDDVGNHTNSFHLLTTCWAYVRQLSGQEVFAAGQVGQEEEILFEVSMRDGLDPQKNFIRWRSTRYNITRIDQYDRRHLVMRIYAKRARN